VELLALLKVLSVGYLAGLIGLSLASAGWRLVGPRLAPAARADVSFAVFAGGSALLLLLTTVIWWGVITLHIRMTTNLFHHLMYGGWALGIALTGAAVLGLSLLLATAAWTRARLPAQPGGQSIEFEGVRLVLTGRVTTAGFVGVLNPQIWANPAYWSSLSAGERRLALHHEQLHGRRRDNLRKLVLQFIAGLYFAFPWLRRLPAGYELSCELAVDDRCRIELPEEAYCALVARGAQFVMQGRSVPVLSGMSAADLSARLAVLAAPRRNAGRVTAVGAAVLLLGVCALPLLALLATPVSRCLVACYLGY
jgi:hypothetical protein